MATARQDWEEARETPDPRIVTKDELLNFYTGFSPVPRWLVRHEGLSFGAKLLYADLLSYVYEKDKRSCWPDKVTLAENLGVSVRTVWTWMKELEDAGLILRRRRSARRNSKESFLLLPPRRVLDNPYLENDTIKRRKYRQQAADSIGGRRLPEGCGSALPEEAKQPAAACPGRTRIRNNNKRTSSSTDDVLSHPSCGRIDERGRSGSALQEERLPTKKPTCRPRWVLAYLEEKSLRRVYSVEKQTARNISDTDLCNLAQEAQKKRSPGGWFRSQLREFTHAFPEDHISEIQVREWRKQDAEKAREDAELIGASKDTVKAARVWPDVVVEFVRLYARQHDVCDGGNSKKAEERLRDIWQLAVWGNLPAGFDDARRLVVVTRNNYQWQASGCQRLLARAVKRVLRKRPRFVFPVDDEDYATEYYERLSKWEKQGKLEPLGMELPKELRELARAKPA